MCRRTLKTVKKFEDVARRQQAEHNSFHLWLRNSTSGQTASTSTWCYIYITHLILSIVFVCRFYKCKFATRLAQTIGHMSHTHTWAVIHGMHCHTPRSPYAKRHIQRCSSSWSKSHHEMNCRWLNNNNNNSNTWITMNANVSVLCRRACAPLKRHQIHHWNMPQRNCENNNASFASKIDFDFNKVSICWTQLYGRMRFRSIKQMVVTRWMPFNLHSSTQLCAHNTIHGNQWSSLIININKNILIRN